MNAEQVQKMLDMRNAGKSYGDISKAFGQKYPAWSRHYILKAKPEMKEVSARKPRNPNRLVVAVSTAKAGYNMEVQIRHGDGRSYGCGAFVGSIMLLDGQGEAKMQAILQEHKSTCTKLSEAERELARRPLKKVGGKR